MKSYRILLTTIGSLGDLHPILALGRGLQARGHTVRIATLDRYADTVRGLGLDFAPVRSFVNLDDKAQLARIMDLKRGSEYLIKDIVFRHIREAHADVLAAAEDVDIIGATEIMYSAQIVADQKKLPWFFCALSPVSFFSSEDVSLLPLASEWPRLPVLTNALQRFLIQAGKTVSASWSKEWHQLRKELALPIRPNPIAEGKFSPFFNLALFSEVLGAPQRDWPGNTLQTGPLFYDARSAATHAPETRPSEDAPLAPGLREFLTKGEPPLVFTLGSAAVHAPGDFYKESLKLAETLRRRAVLLVGDNTLEVSAQENIFVTDYAPFSQLFPRAACVVHQGGVGTCAQALRAGVPTLIVPYSHDQPDNAMRLERLGTSLTLLRSRYTCERALPLLRQLLNQPRYRLQAQTIQKRLKAENGLPMACEKIERFLLRHSHACSVL